MWQTLNMFRGMAPLRVLLDADCLNRLPHNYDGRPRRSVKGVGYYESEDEISDYELESEDETDAALLTDAQVREMKAAFSMLDKNQDGRVNASEIKCMLDSLGILLSDEMIHNLIQEASKRDDDLISEDEFMNWMAKQTGAQDDDVMEDLLAAFRVFDKDRNGFINKDELRIAMDMIGESVSETQLDEMLKVTDIDNDGKINYEEFVRILL